MRGRAVQVEEGARFDEAPGVVVGIITSKAWTK